MVELKILNISKRLGYIQNYSFQKILGYRWEWCFHQTHSIVTIKYGRWLLILSTSCEKPIRSLTSTNHHIRVDIEYKKWTQIARYQIYREILTKIQTHLGETHVLSITTLFLSKKNQSPNIFLLTEGFYIRWK